MKRSECLRALSDISTERDLFVVALGATRVLWTNLHKGEGSYNLIAMGYLNPFGFGLAEALPHRRVVVLDGDGSTYLNLGILTTIGVHRPPNLVLMVMDNGMYEAAGRRPNPSSQNSSLEGIAKASGIERACTVKELSDFACRAKEAMTQSGPFLIDAKIETEVFSLPGSTMDGKENKYRFIRHIEQSEGVSIFRPPGSTPGAPAD